jgi:hypothetical protein
MAKKYLWLGMIIGLLVFSGCASAPIKPAVNQTVVNVARHAAVGGTIATGTLEIYVDGRPAGNMKGNTIKPFQLKRAGDSVSFPVNNGVHTIYVQVGSNQSEAYNFTASGPTVAFVATVDGIPPLRKVNLARSVVDDDTGSLTDREIQSSY